MDEEYRYGAACGAQGSACVEGAASGGEASPEAAQV